MYERYDQPMLSRRAFVARVLRHAGLAGLLLLGSLAVGVAGYMFLAHLSFVDAFLNAAMILGGMGPVDVLITDGAKLFAGVYALYCGLFFLVTAGVILAPFLHRVLHSLHLDDDDDDQPR
ncbi:MAG TPA: hypothetical protein VIF08_02375 [Candidatus Limnocylindrales bacterium]|jgi:hypothetical protein